MRTLIFSVIISLVLPANIFLPTNAHAYLSTPASGGGGTGILTLNGLTADPQLFGTGTTGTDFNIGSLGDTHTFNFPNSSAANRGLLTAADWSTFNLKEPAITAGTTAQYIRGDKTLSSFQSDARSSLSGTAPVVYNSGTGAISMPAASSSTNGYMSSTVYALLAPMPFDMGDGSGGDVVLNSGGTINLTTTMYYNNLTISNNTQLNTGSMRIFVKGTLTIDAGSSISRSGLAGGNASGATGGTAPALTTGGEVGASTAGSAGGTGTTGIGAQAGAPTGANLSFGAIGGSGAAGGSASGGAVAGGSSRSGAGANQRPLRFLTHHPLSGATAITGGAGGGGGGSGGGDGVNAGGGGGAGGAGSAGVMIFANIIANNGSILSEGGKGGNGAAGLGADAGGGAGGGGGGGGWCYLVYNSYSGLGTISVAGGIAGTAGAGSGTGATPGTSTAGSTGNIVKYNLTTRAWE